MLQLHSPETFHHPLLDPAMKHRIDLSMRWLDRYRPMDKNDELFG
jgi:hypothetical protein